MGHGNKAAHCAGGDLADTIDHHGQPYKRTFGPVCGGDKTNSPVGTGRDLSLQDQMKPSPKKLKHIDKKYLWHPFTQMRDWENEDPLIIEKGKGNWLYDVDGKKYLDGISSLWVTVHGHRKREIDRAIKKQIDKISHSTLLGLSNVPATELAEKLIGIAPPNLKKVFYSDNGSTAVEIALKMAFQYWKQQETGGEKKTRFMTFVNAYHGDTIGSVSLGGIDLF